MEKYLHKLDGMGEETNQEVLEVLTRKRPILSRRSLLVACYLYVVDLWDEIRNFFCSNLTVS